MERPAQNNVTLADFLVLNESEEGRIPIIEITPDHIVATGFLDSNKHTPIKITSPYNRAIVQKKDNSYLVGELAESQFERILRAAKD